MILPRPRRYHAGTKLGIKDRWPGLFVIIGLIAAIHLAFGLSLAGIALLSDWLFYPGITLMVLGIFLRQWSTSAPRRVLLSRSSMSRKGRPSSGKDRTGASAPHFMRGQF